MTIGRTRQMEPRRTIVPKARAQRVHRQAGRRQRDGRSKGVPDTTNAANGRVTARSHAT